SAAPPPRYSATPSTSARGRSSRRCCRRPARGSSARPPRSAEMLIEALERDGQVGAPEAEADVAGLAVDRARKQQHTCACGDLLAPLLNVEVALHAREADRPGARWHPFEHVG